MLVKACLRAHVYTSMIKWLAQRQPRVSQTEDSKDAGLKGQIWCRLHRDLSGPLLCRDSSAACCRIRCKSVSTFMGLVSKQHSDDKLNREILENGVAFKSCHELTARSFLEVRHLTWISGADRSTSLRIIIPVLFQHGGILCLLFISFYHILND